MILGGSLNLLEPSEMRKEIEVHEVRACNLITTSCTRGSDLCGVSNNSVTLTVSRALINYSEDNI